MRRYANLAERLRASVLEGEGETRPELRQAIAARAAELAGRPDAPAAANLPENLRGYVDAIALHAHRLTDADVEALRRAGYSEGEVFEISISAALGAGVDRLQRGLGALRGDSGGER